MLVLNAFVQSQQLAPASNASAAVPPLVRFSGTLTDVTGKPLTGVVGVTFLLYKDEQGGAPVWLETQNAVADKNGHYSVMLGSTTSTGLPADIFVAGEARWIAVQPQGQEEQARVLLLSVPYALKAGDAQTLGGMPASAFVLAAPAVSGSTPAAQAPATAAATTDSASPLASTGVTTSGGAASTIPMFTTPTNIQNSLLTQIASAAINVNGVLNFPANGLATAGGGANSRGQNFTASAFNSGISAAVPQNFRWQAEPARNNTATPSATLNLLFGAGTTTPTETGLHVASNGAVTAPSFTGDGSGLTNVTAANANKLGGVASSAFAELNATNNNFTGTENFDGSNSGGVVQAQNILLTGQALAIYGDTFSSGSPAIEGNAINTAGTATGVYGVSKAVGGFGVEGQSPNVGVFGNGTGASGVGVDGQGAFIGVRGVATASTGLAGLFQGTVQMSGNNSSGELQVTNTANTGPAPAIVGTTNSSAAAGIKGVVSATTGTEAGVIGITSSTSGYGVQGLSPNVGVIGKATGATGVGVQGVATEGTGLAGLFQGNVTVTGKVHSGNVAASATASNLANASSAACQGLLTSPNHSCVTPGLSLKVTTSGGPVLVMANLGGVLVANCVIADFYLVMDNTIISTQEFYNFDGTDFNQFTQNLLSLQAPAAGTHTFEVEESDTQPACVGSYAPTEVSQQEGHTSASITRTLIVREF